MITIVTEIAKYLIIFFMVLYTVKCFTVLKPVPADKKRRASENRWTISSKWWYTRGQWKECCQTGCFSRNRNLSGFSHRSAGSVDGGADRCTGTEYHTGKYF